MNKKKLVPELRFEGFDSEWNKYSLGKSVSVKSGYGFKANEYSNSGIPLLQIENVGYGKVKWNKNIYLPIEYIEKCPELVLFEGDIVIALNRPVTNNQLKIAIIKADDSPAILYQRVGKLLIKNEACCSNYIYQAFQKYVKAFVLRESIGSDQPFISIKSLYKLKVPFPILKEQQKIADFLTAIDQRITLLKEKKAALEDYKKGLMQRVFSQEIRFKDYKGNDFLDWEEKRLGEIAEIKRGASPRPISDPKWFDSKSNIGWVRISDVTRSGKFLKQTEQFLSQQGINKSRFIPSGNLIMSICATIGKPVITKIDTCIHDGFIVFENLKLSKEFMFYLLEKIELRWQRYGQPGIQLNLNTGIVSAEKITVPCKEEQQKIANFLSAIDQKINVIDKQISDSELFKKGLLQRMFV